MKTITLEEHFVTKEFLRAADAYGSDAGAGMEAIREKLLDLGSGRIAAMDEGGVDIEVLSLAAIGVDALPAAEQTAVLRTVNDEAAEAVKANPARFAAFATPGLKEPTHGAQELERCVKNFGFKGAFVNGTTDGKFLDDVRFLPVLEAAVALDVPIYIHPAPPPDTVMKAYYSDLPGEAGHMLSIAGWGWHSETAIHVLRMILAGVFDRLPGLRIIIGHMGEGLPFALARTNGVLSAAMKGRERSVMEIFSQQVWMTTSGYFTRPPFECCRAVIGLERMMYSVDYPFSANTRGAEFVRTLNLNDMEREMFLSGTAKSLLKL